MTERMKAQLGANYNYGYDADTVTPEYRPSLAGSTSPKTGELIASAIKGKQSASHHEANHMYNFDYPTTREAGGRVKLPNTLQTVRLPSNPTPKPPLPIRK